MMREPLIVAHRGASISAPENTLAAFRAAVDVGAEGIEFDVRMSRDGVAVVFHDETLVRTAGKNAAVSELTAAELARVDIGSWFDRARGTGGHGRERVATLAETLEFLKEFPGLIFIELKCGNNDVEALTAAVCSAARNSPLFPQVILKSFKLAVIAHARIFAPGIRTAALFAPKIINILRKEKHLVMIAEEFGADELSLHYSLATRKLMESAGKRGLPVHIWTADNPRWVKRGMRLGLRSIITNDPATLLARKMQIIAGQKSP